MPLLTSNENVSEITGNNNSVIQGCNLTNGDIIINQFDILQFEEAYKRSSNQNNKSLTIFILTSSISNIQSDPELNKEEILNHYGMKCEEWNPFSTTPILKLLDEYHRKSGFTIVTYIFDFGNNDVDQTFKNRLSLKRKNAVLIVDSFSLFFSGNVQIAKLFDESEIGGCIIPAYHSCSESIQNKITQVKTHTFSKLVDYISNYSTYLEDREDKGFVQINLDVKNKDDLFRQLTKIASLHLENITRQVTGLNDFPNIPLHI